MECARSSEVILRIGDGDFKGSVTNTERLHVDEHKQLRWPGKFGIALVKLYWGDGSKLLRTAIQIIIHRITAQFRDTSAPHAIDRPFGGTPVNSLVSQVGRKRGSSGINDRIGID